MGQLLTARVWGGALWLDRYGDALPEAIDSSLQIETSGVTEASLRYQHCGQTSLVYAQSGDVKLRLSDDQGITWGGATTLLTGYRHVAHVLDEARGLLVMLMWQISNTSWYLCVGTLDADGCTWTLSTPRLVSAGPDSAGDLNLRTDGAYELGYVGPSFGVHSWECRALREDGSGTLRYNGGGSTFGLKHVVHVLDEALGVRLTAMRQTSDASWYLVVGGVVNWWFGGPQRKITGASADAPGTLIRRTDGVYEFVYPDAGGNTAIVRCRCLGSDGSGTWA